MVNYEDAKSKILDKYKNYKIVNAFDLSNRYVFVLYPKSKDPKNELLLDSFYSVRKDNGKVEDYTPLLDMNEFKKAVKNPLPV